MLKRVLKIYAESATLSARDVCPTPPARRCKYPHSSLASPYQRLHAWAKANRVVIYYGTSFWILGIYGLQALMAEAATALGRSGGVA